jgi:hypothetical protein
MTESNQVNVVQQLWQFSNFPFATKIVGKLKYRGLPPLGGGLVDETGFIEKVNLQ